MRAPDVDPGPRYVPAFAEASDDRPGALTGCDGKTYYLSTDDLAAVQSALMNENIVELQVAPAGTAAQDSAVVCIMSGGQ
jgi:hypothetical protein